MLGGTSVAIASITSAQDLAGGAREDGVVQSDVWLGYLYLYSLYHRVTLQYLTRDNFIDRFGQVDGRSFHDLLRLAVGFAIVNRLCQVVGEPRRSKVEVHLNVHDELLAKLAFGGQRPMTAVEYHPLQNYPIHIRRVSIITVHMVQYARERRYACPRRSSRASLLLARGCPIVDDIES